MGSAHGIEQALIYRLIPMICLAFGYDMLLIIVTALSQRVIPFQLPTAAKIIQAPDNFTSAPAGSHKKQTMKLYVS